jgi:hypothetical protein
MYPAEFNKAKPALNLDFGAIREMYNALDFYGISAYSGLGCAARSLAAADGGTCWRLLSGIPGRHCGQRGRPSQLAQRCPWLSAPR